MLWTYVRNEQIPLVWLRSDGELRKNERLPPPSLGTGNGTLTPEAIQSLVEYNAVPLDDAEWDAACSTNREAFAAVARGGIPIDQFVDWISPYFTRADLVAVALSADLPAHDRPSVDPGRRGRRVCGPADLAVAI